MAANSNRKLIPEAKQGLYKFRTEVAKEMGVPFSDYNGHLSAKECGAVGGEMVKRMVADYENKIK
jgi:small acid-soluble spore protein D (minor alpha/beta-type SASP)